MSVSAYIHVWLTQEERPGATRDWPAMNQWIG